MKHVIMFEGTDGSHLARCAHRIFLPVPRIGEQVTTPNAGPLTVLNVIVDYQVDVITHTVVLNGRRKRF